MKLDNEQQRQLLINCIQSANLTGMVMELLPQLTAVVSLLKTVQTAEIEEKSNVVRIDDLEAGNARKN
jgi:hypothetical protein